MKYGIVTIEMVDASPWALFESRSAAEEYLADCDKLANGDYVWRGFPATRYRIVEVRRKPLGRAPMRFRGSGLLCSGRRRDRYQRAS